MEQEEGRTPFAHWQSTTLSNAGVHVREGEGGTLGHLRRRGGPIGAPSYSPNVLPPPMFGLRIGCRWEGLN